MLHTTSVTFVCLFAIRFFPAYVTQQVHFVVHVPATTAATESVYIAGSLASVGSWKADGVKLTRQSDGTYSGNLNLEIGQTLEFKITRGSWETVEKNSDGGERGNRIITVDGKLKKIDITVERWVSDDQNKKKMSTVVGNLKLHQIDSRALKQSRTIRVWLPPEYDTDTKTRYDVLYMHDGQNCFDRATSAFGMEWEIDETLTKLIAEKRVPPLVVVGIDNGLANRLSEFTYDADPQRGGGEGAVYAKFLLSEVKPFIEKHYRVQSGPRHTFVGGSSLGGLISLEIARRHPDIFGGVIAMSPAIWWNDQSLTQEIEHDVGGLADTRIWIDMGSRESVSVSASGTASEQNQRFVQAARRLDAALTKHRIEHRLTIDDQHAEHNETAWAKRFPLAITYILETKN